MAVQRLLLLATLLPPAFAAFGCGEDVGDCEDRMKQGQDTVLVNGSIQYGGQAIMNIACAQGCHSSDAKGALRNGAPAGLDFDLRPVDPEGADVEGTSTSGDAGTVAKLKDEVASKLRERQRKIFEDRNHIWQQVKDGLMPPSGAFARFRTAIKSIVNSDEATPCAAGKGSFEAITEKSSQDVLRMWLACGAPIVETNSAVVQSYGAPGAAGYQYPVCEGAGVGDAGVGDGGAGTVITLEAVHAKIFSVCSDCHSPEGQQEPDLSTPEKAYEVLVADTAAQCGTKPYVTKGDPTQSFFYEIVAQARPACASRMPPGGALNMSDLRLISDWIKGGAVRAADVEKSVRELQGGLDAAVR